LALKIFYIHDEISINQGKLLRDTESWRSMMPEATALIAANAFQEIPVFRSFNDLTADAHYRLIPEDWWVVVADIEGSTQAIEAGRYKDVNTVGAACIVAA
jgi:hypothetical protein